MVFSDSLATDQIIVGVVSIAGSLVIILTYILFPNLRKLRYVELVFYVAINDLVASIGLALGPVPNDSFACWFQALSSDINYVSAAFWTTVILYQIYLVVIERGTVLKNMTYIHLFCWGWPVVLSLLPLSTSTYNNPDDESVWCFVADRRGSPEWTELFWIIFSFFFWIWLTMVVNLVQIILIVLKLRNMNVVTSVVKSTVRKLIYYPLITLLCWTLNTVSNMYLISTNSSLSGVSASWGMVSDLGILLALSQGIFNAFVFVGMNTIVREHWAELFHRIFQFFCCCRVVKERAVLRTNSSSTEFEGTAKRMKPSVFELEMSDKHSESTHNPNREEHDTNRDTSHSLFRDTFMGGDNGVRLSAYFSVSLPVEDEMDYIGNIYAQEAPVVSVNNDNNHIVNSAKNSRTARRSDESVRDSNFMRQSSLGGFIRGSLAMFMPATHINDTRESTTGGTDSTSEQSVECGTLSEYGERMSDRETVVSTVNPLYN